MLAPLLETDISLEYLETLNDVEYMKYSRNSSFIHTEDSQIEYIAKFRDSINLLFGIKKIEDGKLLGNINCYIDFSKMTLDLGFLIFRNEQGNGFASEALGLLIPYLESQFPGMIIVIGSNKNNVAMHKIATKLGFCQKSDDPQISDTNFRFVRNIAKLNSACQPIIPDLILNARRIGVAAYDAGGAEQISWLLRNIPQRVLAFLDGPARRIFESSGVHFRSVGELNEILECDLIITGSGWMSDLEVNALRAANLRGTPSITLLDHWVNYLERFGCDDDCQPQILAVTNSVALQIAQEKFPNKAVWFFPDFQTESYQEALKSSERITNSVLVLLEPNSTSGSMFAVDSSMTENLIDLAISLKNANSLSTVKIRLHPSQINNGLIVEVLKRHKGEIEVSKASTLLEDLKSSVAVIGINSYAMYISSQCDIPTYSYFRGEVGHWTNQFPNILKVDFS
jgi:RimJ/RimL family protein N-acetyltransferase